MIQISLYPTHQMLELQSINDKLQSLIGRVLKKVKDENNGKHT